MLFNFIRASMGSVDAQLKLGEYYYFCRKNGKHLEKAAYWFRKAAENNNTDAQVYMATLHLQGYGVKQNEFEAFNWYRKAAELGSSRGQHSLGWCYQQGYGTERDFVRAVLWWKKSALQNEPESQHGLGLAYAKGEGVEKDLEEARKWLQLAIANGLEEAKDDLLDLNG
jgi:hypothetical protein